MKFDSDFECVEQEHAKIEFQTSEPLKNGVIICHNPPQVHKLDGELNRKIKNKLSNLYTLQKNVIHFFTTITL